MSSRIVAERAVNTVMSGPASGVLAAAATARAAASTPTRVGMGCGKEEGGADRSRLWIIWRT